MGAWAACRGKAHCSRRRGDNDIHSQLRSVPDCRPQSPQPWQCASGDDKRSNYAVPR